MHVGAGGEAGELFRGVGLPNRPGVVTAAPAHRHTEIDLVSLAFRRPGALAGVDHAMTLFSGRFSGRSTIGYRIAAGEIEGQPGGKERQGDDAGQPGAARPRGRSAHQPADAIEQRGAIRGHRQARRGSAQTFEVRQGAGVAQPVAANRHGQVIAAVLPLAPHLGGNPPDRRVIEKKGFHRRLQKIDQIVVAPHVGQLMSEDRFELPRREPGQRAHGDQDHRPQPADHRRHRHGRRFQELDGASDAQSARQHAHRRLQIAAQGLACPRQAPRLAEAAQVIRREKGDTRQPEAEDPGQDGRGHRGRKALITPALFSRPPPRPNGRRGRGLSKTRRSGEDS